MSHPTLGEPLPIELANTIYARRHEIVDGLATPGDLAAWLQIHGCDVQADASAAIVSEFRELRDAIRALFRATLDGESPPAAAVETLNRTSAAAPAFPRLIWPPDGEPRVEVASSGDNSAAAVLAGVARAAIEFLGGPDRDRLRDCQAPGCVLFFLKDHPRREWCSAGCGNRARAARHYRRHRQNESVNA